MKLTQLNDELLLSREKLLNEKSNSELLLVLRENFPDMTDKIFIIGWIPEQNEDIFTVLVDGNKVAEIEMSRTPPSVNLIDFKVTTVQNYLKENSTISKNTRRKLDAAIQLSLLP